MSITVKDEQSAWLKKKAEETGATEAGVIRMLISKEIKREKEDKRGSN